MAQIQFGLVVPAEFRQGADLSSYLADANSALRMVRGRFESAWVVDHLQSDGDQRLEAVALLSYLAGQNPELLFGHTVLCQSFRSPGLVAKIAATLQLLTGGRFVLGLGAGGNEDEYLAYGYDYPSSATRVEQLEEYVAVIRALWSAPSVSFSGKHYRLVDARCEPRPTPAPPLMIGAFKPRMLRLVAREADWWNVSSTGPQGYARMAAELERACKAVGRDPATVRRTWVGGVACAATLAEARAIAGARVTADDDDYGFVGTPGNVVRQMRALVDLGVECFMLDVVDFPDLGGLELLLRHVLPELGA